MEGRDRRATGADRWGDSPDPIDLGAGEFLTAFSSSGWGSGVSASGVPHDQEEHALRAAGRRTNVGCRSIGSSSPRCVLFPALHGWTAAEKCADTGPPRSCKGGQFQAELGVCGMVKCTSVPDCLRSVGRTDVSAPFSGY
ncbi:hypothetical protein HPB47_003650 [Ixodes persulcatus]|uniref:Uncharacterized protein n=1 Tax=Ixodes persulcatus TaxID=34615 RepID=A0AC60PHZ2_IXOPE|nr:hypothetical protein HPB47_003650 [Ixodes persulcatus]